MPRGPELPAQIDADGLVEELDHDECAPVVLTRQFLADPSAAVARVLTPEGPAG